MVSFNRVPGRRKCLASSFIGLGISCFLMAFVPKQNSTLILVLYLAGKYCASFGTSMCWLVTSELYPTNLRSQAVGTCSMVARWITRHCSWVRCLCALVVSTLGNKKNVRNNVFASTKNLHHPEIQYQRPLNVNEISPRCFYRHCCDQSKGLFKATRDTISSFGLQSGWNRALC